MLNCVLVIQSCSNNKWKKNQIFLHKLLKIIFNIICHVSGSHPNLVGGHWSIFFCQINASTRSYFHKITLSTKVYRSASTGQGVRTLLHSHHGRWRLEQGLQLSFGLNWSIFLMPFILGYVFILHFLIISYFLWVGDHLFTDIIELRMRSYHSYAPIKMKNIFASVLSTSCQTYLNHATTGKTNMNVFSDSNKS